MLSSHFRLCKSSHSDSGPAPMNSKISSIPNSIIFNCCMGYRSEWWKTQDEYDAIQDVGFAGTVEASDGVEMRVEWSNLDSTPIGLETIKDDVLHMHPGSLVSLVGCQLAAKVPSNYKWWLKVNLWKKSYKMTEISGIRWKSIHVRKWKLSMWPFFRKTKSEKAGFCSYALSFIS